MNDNENNDKDRLEVEKTFIPPLREAAITLHVMYEELRLAGFSRRDALFLISNVMVTSLFGPVDDK
jgi:hypothetical protein